MSAADLGFVFLWDGPRLPLSLTALRPLLDSKSLELGCVLLAEASQHQFRYTASNGMHESWAPGACREPLLPCTSVVAEGVAQGPKEGSGGARHGGGCL